MGHNTNKRALLIPWTIGFIYGTTVALMFTVLLLATHSDEPVGTLTAFVLKPIIGLAKAASVNDILSNDLVSYIALPGLATQIPMWVFLPDGMSFRVWIMSPLNGLLWAFLLGNIVKMIAGFMGEKPKRPAA